MRSNVEIITANHKTYNYFITIQVMEPVEVAWVWVRAWCECGLANGNGMRDKQRGGGLENESLSKQTHMAITIKAMTEARQAVLQRDGTLFGVCVFVFVFVQMNMNTYRHSDIPISICWKKVINVRARERDEELAS